MGSTTALPSAPEQKTKFVEDMTESEMAKVVSNIKFLSLRTGTKFDKFNKCIYVSIEQGFCTMKATSSRSLNDYPYEIYY